MSSESSNIMLERLEEEDKKLIEKTIRSKEIVYRLQKGNYSEYLVSVDEKVLKLRVENAMESRNMEFDKIARMVFSDYLRDGELILVVEEGIREKLLKRDGLYAKACKEQLMGG